MKPKLVLKIKRTLARVTKIRDSADQEFTK